jgi:hypothetical protein
VARQAGAAARPRTGGPGSRVRADRRPSLTPPPPPAPPGCCATWTTGLPPRGTT